MTARLTPQAHGDLDAIRSYLTPLSPQGAEHVRLAIAETIALLAEFPHCGHTTSLPEVRVLPVVRFPYLIYHLVSADEALIIHIRHAARQAPAIEDLQP